MFKRFVSAFIAVSMIATPALAGSFNSGRSFSSGSSFRSSSFSSSYRPSISSGSSFRSSTYKSSYTPTYKSTVSSPSYRPAVSQPRYTSGSTYNYKPSQTSIVSRPAYSGYSNYRSTPVVQNHYYGGGGGSFGGGTFSSPWFWMYMMNVSHPQPAPVYVNGGGAPGVAMGSPPVQVVDNGPGFFGMIFWGLVNFIVFVGFIAMLVWVGRKIYNMVRK